MFHKVKASGAHCELHTHSNWKSSCGMLHSSKSLFKCPLLAVGFCQDPSCAHVFTLMRFWISMHLHESTVVSCNTQHSLWLSLSLRTIQVHSWLKSIGEDRRLEKGASGQFSRAQSVELVNRQREREYMYMVLSVFPTHGSACTLSPALMWTRQELLWMHD